LNLRSCPKKQFHDADGGLKGMMQAWIDFAILSTSLNLIFYETRFEV
jgi:hypothetical protein